jgi:hypothetical protein
VRSNAPPTEQALQSQVDAYIAGQNLDRTQLYQYWNQVADYVVQGFRAEAANNSPLTARYVNLIGNALNIIDNGKYLAPTLRSDADQSSKPERLGSNNPIPGFAAGDYGKIVNLLCGNDAGTRNAAQRLLRTFPADDFYAPLQSLQKQDNCKTLFVFESAVYYFYNRIVEYDGTWALDAASIDWLQGNLNDGNGWVKLATAADSSQDVYGALLDFGYGLDFWDRSDSAISQAKAKPYFQSMLTTLGSSKGVYPSSGAHIALALRAVNDQKVPKATPQTTPADPNSLHPVGKIYIVGEAGIALFAIPDTSTKSIGNLNPNGNVRIFMQATGWDLVQSGAQFGWAQRAVTSAGK